MLSRLERSKMENATAADTYGDPEEDQAQEETDFLLKNSNSKPRDLPSRTALWGIVVALHAQTLFFWTGFKNNNKMNKIAARIVCIVVFIGYTWS